MRTVWRAVGATLALTASAATADAQPGDRSAHLPGSWTCSVAGIPPDSPTTGASMRFDTTRMWLTFHGRVDTVTMKFTIDGPWSYNQSADSFTKRFENAYVYDIFVSGQPMARNSFPGGEPALKQMEEDFLAQYGNSKLDFATVTANRLVMRDGDGSTVDCTK